MLFSIVLIVVIFADVGTSKSKSVNLELETVLEFDGKNDASFLKSIQNILDLLRTVPKSKTHKKQKQREPTFIDVLNKTFRVITLLKDSELKYVTRIIGEKIKSYDTEDPAEEEFRRFLSHKLNKFRQSPTKIQKDIQKLLNFYTEEKRNTNKVTHNIFNFVDNVFKKEDTNALMKELDLLQHSRKRSRRNLAQLTDSLTRYTLKLLKAFRRQKDRTQEKQERSNVLNNFHNNEVVQMRNEENGNRQRLIKNEKESVSREEKEDEFTTKFKKKKITQSYKKLTHITLYPSSIEVSPKKRILEPELLPEKNLINQDDNGTEDTEKKEESIEVFNRKKSTELFEEALKTKSSKTSKTKMIDKTPTELISNTKSKYVPITSSFEHFGSLYRDKDSKIRSYKTKEFIKTDTTNFIDGKNNASTTNSYKDDEAVNEKNIYLNRRYFIPQMNEHNSKLNSSMITEFNSNSKKDKIATHTTKNDVPTTNITTETQNINNITTKLHNNKTTEATNSQITTNIQNPQNVEVNTENNVVKTVNLTDFDVNKFIKNSEIQNEEDLKKRKEIEKKLKEDLSFLFSTTNATSETYTDVFKDLEDAFEIN